MALVKSGRTQPPFLEKSTAMWVAIPSAAAISDEHDLVAGYGRVADPANPIEAASSASFDARAVIPASRIALNKIRNTAEFSLASVPLHISAGPVMPLIKAALSTDCR